MLVVTIILFSNTLTCWRLCPQLEEKAEREAERAKEKEERDRRRDETRRAKAHGLDDMAVSPCLSKAGWGAGCIALVKQWHGYGPQGCQLLQLRRPDRPRHKACG